MEAPSSLEFALAIRSDEYIRQPLWNFRPEERPLVIAERRRRFGIADEEIGDPEYS
ncbi:hypothetical protein [Streptomyces nigrescens]|uniref:hypothetical protein n=1 Tax=Streptomyces nigrescens TaxID=1920 RepID=UPI0037FB51F8